MLKRFLHLITTTTAAVLFGAGCASVASVESPPAGSFDYRMEAETRVERLLQDSRQDCTTRDCYLRLDPGSAVDSIIVDRFDRTLRIEFNDAFAQIPFRAENVARIRESVLSALGADFRDFGVSLWAGGYPIEELVPNLLRPGSIPIDTTRRPDAPRALRRHVLNLDRPILPSKGLDGRHIAIWPSHGWYYEASLDRWEWQRPRLFRSVEDLLPMSFIVPYLEPMLRRAGASVYLPRERDVQANEVIVDNDGVEDGRRSRYTEHTPAQLRWTTAPGAGFAYGSGLLEGSTNPFRQGTARVTRTDRESTVYAEWIPDIPAGGNYAVYVSYAQLPGATVDARYTVYHLGGATSFSVDQTMGGGTWTYLGSFDFEQGVRPIGGRVTLQNGSAAAGSVISADAVRFGGGMGNVVRGRSTSGRPRFTEGARYYMQFSGMPDSLVYNVTETLNDYTDDYRGRAEWVNYLKGAPSGPNKDRNIQGLGVPIDISLAFHTDAGVTKSDTTIGTLMIYSDEGFDAERTFPDGISRITNRDLGDIMQTQIVADLSALFKSDWTRRSIWDRDYSEAVRPNVPGVLLELLSHQNFADMQFALDPRFRYHTSRAIYKAILRYLSSQNDEPYVVQPLAVTHAYAEIMDSGGIRLRWNPSTDPLEASAEPTGFIVYTRRDDSAFDNGTFVSAPEYQLTNLDRDVVYSFRIAAVNDGGESALSEVIAVGLGDEPQSPVLVVNGFDRVSGPASIKQGNWKGFADFIDEGVADGQDASFVGEQYDFEVDSLWLDDDSPGHGASHANFETQVLTGNTFDYASVHGEALLAAGRSFVTASNEAVAERFISLDSFEIVDVILGEQRTTVLPGNRRTPTYRTFSLRLQAVLQQYTERGGALFVSGAYVGTDLNGSFSREEDKRFAEEVLRMKWRTNYGSLSGFVTAAGDALLPYGTAISYNTDPTGSVYRVEAPDAVEPIDTGGETILRYGDNNTAAGYGYYGGSGVVVLGFPFETVVSYDDRVRLMSAILDFLSNGE